MNYSIIIVFELQPIKSRQNNNTQFNYFIKQSLHTSFNQVHVLDLALLLNLIRCMNRSLCFWKEFEDFSCMVIITTKYLAR